MKRKRRTKAVAMPEQKHLKKPVQGKPWLWYPLFAFAGLTVLAVIMISLLSKGLPSLEELEQAGDPFLITRIVSSNDRILAELFKQKRIKVPLERIPEHLIEATLASEDRRFFHHWGLDSKRIYGSILHNIKSMDLTAHGASTLTQQLARNLYLTRKKNYIRKLKEQLTAIEIERTYSKNEILEMYLNYMPLGRGAHGVQAASLAYFNKNVWDLDIDESAMITGMFQLPYGYYNPDRDTVETIKRRNVVLMSMKNVGYLSDAQYDSLRNLPLGVVERGTKGKRIAPHFCEYVRLLMQERYGERLYTDGLTIYTTLDTRIQACADSAVKAFIPGLEEKIHKRIIEKREFTDWISDTTEQETDEWIQTLLKDTVLIDSLLRARATLQTALVAIEPATGCIRAMIGGRGDDDWYNRAVQAKRQPGSSFKPIVYTVAIDNGWPATTELLNQPVVLEMLDGTRWSPKNYDGSTGGRTSFREAIKRSLNLVTVRLIQELIPPQKVVDYARNFGLTTTIYPYDGVGLGQDPVIPLEIVSAFTVFPNRGVHVEPLAVLRVEDKEGNVIDEFVPRQQEVINEETAYVMTDLLRTVVDDPRGTGFATRWRYNFRRPAAGKTGTTNDFRNAWFVGFTPQLAAGVWVGFDDERITLGEGQAGAVTALPIWAPFMKMTYDTLGSELPYADFEMPGGVVRVKICKETKKLATDTCPEIMEEIFIRGTEPTETCEIHRGPNRTRRERNIY